MAKPLLIPWITTSMCMATFSASILFSQIKKEWKCKILRNDKSIVACENIRFSSLFAAGDVSRGGMSATQRQKFHTDDVKSVKNPVRSADWLTE